MLFHLGQMKKYGGNAKSVAIIGKQKFQTEQFSDVVVLLVL